MSTGTLGPRSVEITNGDRVVYPDLGITKSDVVAYYQRVADRLLPAVGDRPLVMYRFPDGLDGDGFFQKQVPSHFPGWIDTVSVPRRSGGEVVHVVCDDAATLAYVVNQGAFELHTLLVPADDIDHPDELILDLDPSNGDGLDVVRAARATRAVLDDLHVRGFVKSTGSRGVHVHIPLDGEAHIDAVHDTARRLAARIVEADPDLLTIEHSKSERGDRVFVDWLRNGYGQHAVAPYSLRARRRATVALPMDWNEVTAAAFDPGAFTIDNVFRRLSRKADPWAGIDSVEHALDQLEP